MGRRLIPRVDDAIVHVLGALNLKTPVKRLLAMAPAWEASGTVDQGAGAVYQRIIRPYLNEFEIMGRGHRSAFIFQLLKRQKNGKAKFTLAIDRLRSQRLVTRKTMHG